jgi:hypothetical protein
MRDAGTRQPAAVRPVLAGTRHAAGVSAKVLRWYATWNGPLAFRAST